MRRGDWLALAAGAALLLAVAWDAAQPWQTASSPDNAVVEAEPEELAEASPLDMQPLLDRLDEDYLENWEWMPNLAPLLSINQEYTLCYREVWSSLPGSSLEEPLPVSEGYALRYQCVVRHDATDKSTPLLITEGQLFARAVSGVEYGLILDDSMLVFYRGTMLPLRLEARPELEVSDIVSPEYLEEWYSLEARQPKSHLYTIARLGERELCSTTVTDWTFNDSGKISEVILCLLRDEAEGLYTPLYTIPDASMYPSGQPLADGRFAIYGPRGWTLLLDPDSAEPLALLDRLDGVREDDWYPVASLSPLVTATWPLSRILATPQ